MDNTDLINNLVYEMKGKLKMIKYKHPRPADLDRFLEMYKRFLRSGIHSIDWEKIGRPSGKLFNYADLNGCYNKLVSKLAVLKLNGGLGTTMGCDGPKSGIKVRGDSNFLDMSVKQITQLEREYECSVPLVLMNSFLTNEETQRMIKEYNNIRMFNQSLFPRICNKSYKLFDTAESDMWYPPGHGDLFYSIKQSGILDELLDEGKEFLFISNIDNLAATVDPKILGFMATEKMDFVMEVTPRTRADIKGGTLVDYDGELRLLEIAQVPAGKRCEFQSIAKFPIFNTNSVWVNLRALKAMDNEMELDLIENNKTVSGEEVIQLETAIGSAVRYFVNNCGVIVPRSRFAPVKTCSDLLMVESNLFVEENGHLQLEKSRISEHFPLVRLFGSHFETVKNFENAFPYIPDIIDLESLTVVGNVLFKKDIVLKGTVIIIENNGGVIEIPERSIIEDKLIYNSEVFDTKKE